MRRLILPLAFLGMAVFVGVSRRTVERTPSGAAPPLVATQPTSPTCRWQPEQRFAFDVAVDSELTFDETALAPGRAAGGSAGRTEKATATGRLDAKVISVNAGGRAILAARLPTWTTNAAGAGAFPAIDADMNDTYLLELDERCHLVATARPKRASVIAYRRVLGVLDRLDFALPQPRHRRCRRLHQPAARRLRLVRDREPLHRRRRSRCDRTPSPRLRRAAGGPRHAAGAGPDPLRRRRGDARRLAVVQHAVGP